MAAYQLDETLIEAYRRVNLTEGALLSVLAWSSFQAAMRIISWIE
jgi:hypothetical protein